jgi:hypothetical protein
MENIKAKEVVIHAIQQELQPKLHSRIDQPRMKRMEEEDVSFESTPMVCGYSI